MAHKKGQGSSRNGRDSNAQRLGVKRFAGQWVTGGSILVRQRAADVANARARNAPYRQFIRRICQFGLGTHHKHGQPFERGRQQVPSTHQQDGITALRRIGKANEAGLHASFRRTKCSQAGLISREQGEILRQLPLQETAGVRALYTDNTQVGQGDYAIQSGSHGLNYHHLPSHSCR